MQVSNVMFSYTLYCEIIIPLNLINISIAKAMNKPTETAFHLILLTLSTGVIHHIINLQKSSCLQSKRNYKQDEKTTLRMGGNICQRINGQRINLQNI